MEGARGLAFLRQSDKRHHHLRLQRFHVLLFYRRSEIIGDYGRKILESAE
jgi:hypothetical protein